MPLFEVFIPAVSADAFDITARIEADSWMQALRNGLSKLGDTSEITNIFCDIQEDGIHVTEPDSGRVFRIKEMGDAAPAPTAPAPTPIAAPAPQAPPAAQPATPSVPTSQAAPATAPVAPAPASPNPFPAPSASPSPAAQPVSAPQPVTAPQPVVAPQPIKPAAPAVQPAPVQPQPVVTPQPVAVPQPSSHPVQPVAKAQPTAAAAPAPQPTKPLARQQAPSAQPIAPAPAGGPSQPPMRAPLIQARPRFVSEVQSEEIVQAAPPVGQPIARIGRKQIAVPKKSVEELLGDLMMDSQGLYDKTDLMGAASFLLDLAMRSIPADSGAVFISDINRNDLYFAAARGPKADEVMSFRVPMGQGIVGFSAQEGVSLAVSEVQRDPRFYAKISQALGYETRSILCSPAQQEGRVFGALELINKTQGSMFSSDEVSILNFLAHEFAEYLVNTGQTGD